MCEYSIGSFIESTESNMKTTFPSEMYGATLAELHLALSGDDVKFEQTV